MADNFLILDFGSNRSGGNKADPLFATGVEEQYEKTALSRKNDFEDYIRCHLVGEKIAVHISYPNFDRGSELRNDNHGNVFYNNVALRFNGLADAADLILMGDVVEKTTEYGVKRHYKVKGILVMDSNVGHFGEITTECKIVARLSKDSGWEGPDGYQEMWPSDEHQRNNVFSNDLMLKLQSEFVVKDPQKVIEIFDSWNNYLNSRTYLVDENSKKGYLIQDPPEILRAFVTDGDIDFEPLDPYLNVKNQTWTKEKVNESSRETLVVHFFIDENNKEYEQNHKGRKDTNPALDGFTRNPVAIVDPIANDRNKNNSLIPIRDGRITTSSLERIEPYDELIGLDNELKLKISRIQRDSNEAMKNAIKSDLEKYSKSDELNDLIKSFLDDQKIAVTNKMTVEIQNRIHSEQQKIDTEIASYNDDLNKHEKKKDSATVNKLRLTEALNSIKEKDSKLLKSVDGDEKRLTAETKRDHEKAVKDAASIQKEIAGLKKKEDESKDEIGKLQSKIDAAKTERANLSSKYDLSTAIHDELTKLQKEYYDSLIETKREDLESELGPKYKKRSDELQNDAKAENQALREEAITERTIARFHLFYEVEMLETDNISSFEREIKSRMKPGLELRKDFSGEIAIIKRQQKALDSLRRGFVMNPFLATALFSPMSMGEPSVRKDVDFYLENLNDSQKEAVTKAISSNGTFLLQGPPGTGKTQVIAEITAQLVKEGKKVLIASENNKAVDNAFGRLPKIPMIRPMRILSENSKKKDNQHSMDNLLRNFYFNVSSSLDREIKKYTNHQKYDEELEEKIKDLKTKYASIVNTEDKIAEVQSRIDQIEAEIKLQNEKLEDIESTNSNYASEKEENEAKKEKITSFEDDEFRNRILKKIVSNCSLQIEDIDVINLFEVLYKVKDSDIVDEYILYDDHVELFKLLSEKNDAKTSEITNFNKKIHKYENDNDISLSDFKIITLFNGIVPDESELRKAKEILDEEVSREISSIEKTIAGCEKHCRDPTNSRNQISSLRKELQRCRDDPVYRDLEKQKTEFSSTVRSIFIDLNITETFDNPDDSIDRLEDERKRIKREYQNNRDDTEKKIEAYKKISKYLKTEDVITKDGDRYNPRLLDCVNVIGMTCSADNRFKNEFSNDSDRISLSSLNIDVVIIDEVSKISFIELLQPILYGKTVILVGDHKQLPPMFSEKVDANEMEHYDSDIINPDSEEQYRLMFEDKSFFEELFDITPEANRTMLTTQYRMHSAIMDVDNVFYGGKLDLGCKDSEKCHYLNINGAHDQKILDESRHVLFIDCKGRERKESGSTSYYNEEEAEVVKRLLDLINQNCRYDRNGNKLGKEIDPTNDTRLSVGVICPYADQARRIRGKKTQKFYSFNNSQEEKFMVKTVDDFQGDERDVIILSMVRTRKEAKFLQNYHRINVAVSRARRLLIIVGNKDALSPMKVEIDGEYKQIYRDMIREIQKRNGSLTEDLIVGGE